MAIVSLVSSRRTEERRAWHDVMETPCNSLPLNIDVSKMKCPFGKAYFQGATVVLGRV